jgi:hypothetical protein
MHRVVDISGLPDSPALYVFEGGKGTVKFVAYVGTADHLRNAVNRHMNRRDSHEVIGTSAVSLNPDYITGLDWWEHPFFSASGSLEAAEILAMEIFDPIIRSRSAPSRRAKDLLQDRVFKQEITQLLKDTPSGSMSFPFFQDLVERITSLETDVEEIKKKLEPTGE